jgi:mannose-6-phosphate isomerase-like protein (cupin superfamily)
MQTKETAMPRFAAAALGIACVAFAGTAPGAPAHRPAVAPVPYLLKTAASLADLEKTLGGAGAHGADLVKAAGPVAVEVVWKREEENVMNGVESHDGRDHVFFVTDGKAVFTLGGELQEAKEVSPGEWRAPRSKGSQVVELKKGDLLFIPHGTVHARSTKGTHFTMLQISFWPGGAPQPSPRP